MAKAEDRIIVKYEIVWTEQGAFDLERLVAEKLLWGWQPFGGPFIARLESLQTDKLCQAMVQYGCRSSNPSGDS